MSGKETNSFKRWSIFKPSTRLVTQSVVSVVVDLSVDVHATQVAHRDGEYDAEIAENR